MTNAQNKTLDLENLILAAIPFIKPYTIIALHIMHHINMGFRIQQMSIDKTKIANITMEIRAVPLI
jgi:hypothetical protein